MDDKQRREILKYAKSIEDKQGEGSIFMIDSKYSNMKIPRWSTGIEDLDNILGGGLPKGRIIELYGNESTGKTSLAFHFCSLHELCLYIPAEGTFDAQRAKLFGNRKGQMIIYNDCKYAEDIMEKIISFVQLKIPLIVVDSVPGMVPKSTYDLALNKVDKEGRRAELASFLSRTLKPLNDLVETKGTTILFINQTRAKMNASLFEDPDTTPGGKALRFYASIRIKIARRSWIEVPNKDASNSATNERVGIISKVKIVKSKVSPPLKEAELPMFFDCGYCSHDDIKSIRKEIMSKNNERNK